MTFDELKNEFAQMSREQKQRFMEEVGLDLCKEMMSDTTFMDRMMPRCMEMMGHMPELMRLRMQEWMAGGKKS